MKSPRSNGSSRSAHSSRELFHARSLALFIVQLQVKVATALR